MTLEELQVLITANTTELKNELKESKKELASLEREVKKKTNNIAGFFKKMIPIGVLAIGFKKLASSSEQAYKSQIQNETRLLAVMQKRGEATKQDIQDILNLTDAEQSLGVVSDEVQLAGAQELSTYIDKAGSIKKLLPQLNNMIAQQYGYNATQEEAINIATMMGKVLEGQTGALSRYGYYFDENQEKILKFGTEEEKVATLTSIIHDSIGDVNEALGNTAVGKQIQLANAWSDVKEQLGYVIVQVKQVLVPVFQVLVTWLGTAVSYLRQFLQVLGFTASKQNGVNKAIIGGASAETEYGDAVEDSTKKQNKQLASFDEMNVLKENNSSDDSGSTGNSSGIGGVNNIDFNIGIDGDVEVTNRIKEMANNLKEILGKIFEPFKISWENVGDGVLESVKNMFSSLKESALSVGNSLFEVWTNGTGEEIITNTMLGWQQIFDIVTGLSTSFTNAWNEAGVGTGIIQKIADIFTIIQKFGLSVGETIKKWVVSDGFQNALHVVFSFINDIFGYVKEIAEWASKMYEKYLKPVIEEKILPAINSIIADIGDIWNVVKPVIDKIINIIKKILEPVIKTLGQVIGGIIDVISGIVKFVAGIFTGDWKKAWEGVKKIFSGVWDAMKSVVSLVFNAIWSIIKGVINTIIKGFESFINFVIKGLNFLLTPLRKLGNSILKLVGAKIEIPQISTITLPRLEKGAVIDKPTLAEIGENGREVVMPLENNTGWISELAEEINERNNSMPTHITFKIGEDTVVDKFIDDIKKKGFETNGEVVLSL